MHEWHIDRTRQQLALEGPSLPSYPSYETQDPKKLRAAARPLADEIRRSISAEKSYHGSVDPSTATLPELYAAARQGSADAQHALGRMHALGEGVPINERKADLWLRRAAEQDHGPAQRMLGMLHAETAPNDHALDTDVPGDPVDAYAWLTLSPPATSTTQASLPRSREQWPASHRQMTDAQRCHAREMIDELEASIPHSRAPNGAASRHAVPPPIRSRQAHRPKDRPMEALKRGYALLDRATAWITSPITKRAAAIDTDVSHRRQRGGEDPQRRNRPCGPTG